MHHAGIQSSRLAFVVCTQALVRGRLVLSHLDTLQAAVRVVIVRVVIVRGSGGGYCEGGYCEGERRWLL